MFIFDIEIKHGIAPSDQNECKPNIKYCHGWTDYAAMGVACIGVWDYRADTSRVFGEHELEEFQKFADSHDVAVGFNNIRFDNNVLEANKVIIKPNKSYDILFEIRRKLGTFQKGCRLDDVIKANFPNSTGKTGNGADAPVWWQQGFYTKVVDYCLNDVRLTKMLLDKIIRTGHIKNPIQPTDFLHLRRP